MDRPGLRGSLAYLATAYARRKTGLDVRLFYAEGARTREAGSLHLAESPTFEWTAPTIARWKPDMADRLDMYRDWWFHQHTPKPGDTVVDIGAGIGDDAILFSRTVGPTGRVLSVEAHPFTYQLLKRNRDRNDLKNVTVEHLALMDKDGFVAIDERTKYETNTITHANGQNGTAHQVPACSLDDLCARHKIDRIDFLKINIEGAERFAIKGMTRMIDRTSALCIACHDFIGERDEFYRTKALVVDFLKSNGFTIALREQHSDPWVSDHVYGIRSR